MPKGWFPPQITFPTTCRSTVARFAAAAGAVLAIACPVFGQSAGQRHRLRSVPANLVASDTLRDVVAAMSTRSSTFRQQCAVIGAARGLVLRMRDHGPRGDRPYTARTIIRRHEFGALIAVMELYTPLDPAETIAHEFEHLIEQIEGVNLRLLSFVAGSGVVKISDGSYETRRAVIAGRTVARECGTAETNDE